VIAPRKTDPFMLNVIFFVTTPFFWLIGKVALELIHLNFLDDRHLPLSFFTSGMVWVPCLVANFFQGFFLRRFKINLVLWSLATLGGAVLVGFCSVFGFMTIAHILIATAELRLLDARVKNGLAWLAAVLVLPFIFTLMHLNYFFASVYSRYSTEYIVTDFRAANFYGLMGFIYSIGTTWAVSVFKPSRSNRTKHSQ
jgi:hypothetical protein